MSWNIPENLLCPLEPDYEGHTERCSRCKEDIFMGDDYYDADDCYFYEDEFYCEDCFKDMMEEFRYRG